MRNRLLRGVAGLMAFVTACLLIIGCAPVRVEDTVSETQALIDGILSYKMRQGGAQTLQDWLDGALQDEIGSTAEWYVLALKMHDSSLDASAYVRALEAYIEEKSISGAASREKMALVLMACGRGDHPFVQKTCDAAIGAQGIMSLIYGLYLLENGQTSALYTAESLSAEIANRQLSDGGWALNGERGDIDVTAMALQALSLGGRQEEAAARGLELLSARQNEDGGYSGFGGPNAESTAQVIMALTALGVDPISDERFIKNGCTALDALLSYRLEEGGFAHMAGEDVNQSATVQALEALASLESFERGGRTFYDISSPLTQRGTKESGSAPEKVPSKINVRFCICLVLMGMSGVISLVLWLAGRRHYKNLVLVWAVCGALCLGVMLIRVQSAGEYYGTSIDKGECIGQVTMSIRCDTVAEALPPTSSMADGVVLPETIFDLAQGETVYDLLVEAARTCTLQMESEGSGGMIYVSGIENLYEYDYGDLSGWMYQVNGDTPSVGCAEYALSPGDVIVWRYTCDLGHDLED